MYSRLCFAHENVIVLIYIYTIYIYIYCAKRRVQSTVPFQYICHNDGSKVRTYSRLCVARENAIVLIGSLWSEKKLERRWRSWRDVGESFQPDFQDRLNSWSQKGQWTVFMPPGTCSSLSILMDSSLNLASLDSKYKSFSSAPACNRREWNCKGWV